MAHELEERVEKARAYCVFARLVLPPYTVHFKSPTYFQPTTLDLLDKTVCKETLKSTAHDEFVRRSIGSDAKFWGGLVELSKAAIPSLERRSFNHWDPSGADYESTSGALIASNYPGLWRDLERLNDVVSIGRNCLTTGEEAQDLAADYSVDAQIFRLINCSVRVTARGYDGDAETPEQDRWSSVVNAYKKLLITSLQFLNNFVAQNEKRKLNLWVSLFDSASESGLIEEAEGIREPDEPVPPEKPTPPINGTDILLAYGQNGPNQRISPLEYEAAQPSYKEEGFKPMPPNAVAAKKHYEPNGYVYFTHRNRERIISEFKILHKRSPTLGEIHRNLPRYWHEQTRINSRLWNSWQDGFDKAVEKFRSDEEEYQAYAADPQGWRDAKIREKEEHRDMSGIPPLPPKRPDQLQSTEPEAVKAKIKALEEQMAEKYKSESLAMAGVSQAGNEETMEGASAESTLDVQSNPLDPRSADEDKDMRMLFTADAGTKILESGKAELMKRLEGYAQQVGDERRSSVNRSVQRRSYWSLAVGGDAKHQDASGRTRRRSSTGYGVEDAFAEDSLDEEDDEDSNSDEASEDEDEEDYPGSTEDGRGLLTDVPLILGPSEIEVLPMFIMSGLVVAPPDPNPSKRNNYENTDPTSFLYMNLKENEDVLRNGATLRTHLLLSQTSGRNLLRELLIFVAAWDLREEELYFKFMVRILEAILKDGLMPYAYHAFRDRSRSKDIISPAQAVIMKLLTCIFRQRNENYRKLCRGEIVEGHMLTRTQLQAQGSTSAFPDKAKHPEFYQTLVDQEREARKPFLLNNPSKVDIHVLNFIFTEFRQHIIPQTCALIFLQGQIHRGRASPEDFPLNLWDMERMYEGVYQYLEFFAVLTEDQSTMVHGPIVEENEITLGGDEPFSWKNVLADWEMASELVTLLRELEGGIPKVPAPPPLPPAPTEQKRLAQRSMSADVAVGMSAAQQGANAPVAVERPFDVDASSDGATLPPLPLHPPQNQIFEPETPLAYPEDPAAGTVQDEPSDFEWRNLKKLTVLVLSSLIWKNKQVQDQVREFGGLDTLVGCCQPDEANPYIREHAIMCLRFALEGNEESSAIIRKMAAEKASKQREGKTLLLETAGADGGGEDVPKEVLDTNGYETFMDAKGQVGLRRKNMPAETIYAPSSASSAAASKPKLSGTKLTAEKAAELMQTALRDLPLGDKLVTDRQKAEALARLDRAFERTEESLGSSKADAGGSVTGKKG